MTTLAESCATDLFRRPHDLVRKLLAKGAPPAEYLTWLERYLDTVALQRSPPAHHLNHHGSNTYEGASLTVRSGGVALDLQGLFEVLNCRRQRPRRNLRRPCADRPAGQR
jgi:hypothetical protein